MNLSNSNTFDVEMYINEEKIKSDENIKEEEKEREKSLNLLKSNNKRNFKNIILEIPIDEKITKNFSTNNSLQNLKTKETLKRHHSILIANNQQIEENHIDNNCEKKWIFNKLNNMEFAADLIKQEIEDVFDKKKTKIENLNKIVENLSNYSINSKIPTKKVEEINKEINIGFQAKSFINKLFNFQGDKSISDFNLEEEKYSNQEKFEEKKLDYKNSEKTEEIQNEKSLLKSEKFDEKIKNFEFDYNIEKIDEEFKKEYDNEENTEKFYKHGTKYLMDLIFPLNYYNNGNIYSNISSNYSNSMRKSEDLLKLSFYDKSFILVNIEDQMKCNICLDFYNEEEIIKPNDSCIDTFCKSCLVFYLVESIKTGQVISIKCPNYLCGVQYSEAIIKKNVNEEIFEKYLYFKKIISLSKNPNIRWCIRPGCEKFFEGSSISPKIVCDCGTAICFNCSNNWHEGKTCEEVIDQEYQGYLKKVKIQKCPKCKSRIEKSQGLFFS